VEETDYDKHSSFLRYGFNNRRKKLPLKCFPTIKRFFNYKARPFHKEKKKSFLPVKHFSLQRESDRVNLPCNFFTAAAPGAP
jgi:hypothetical protein